MKLIAYAMPGLLFGIRPAPLERDWMDATSEAFAYRCLPLTIANQHGWEILCTAGFTAVWDGSSANDAVTITPDQPEATQGLPVSHFGHGVLTFHIPALFRTEPGYNLIASGPINRVRHGLQALTGLIETDWAPYTFTMNWKFTAPDTPAHFAFEEPFCHIMPVPRGLVEQQEPEIIHIDQAPEIKAAMTQWSQSRNQWIADSKDPTTQAARQQWQKHYFQGKMPDGARVAEHQTKLRVEPFVFHDSDAPSGP